MTKNDKQNKRNRKGALIAISLGVIAIGGVLASAASLGSNTSASIGAGVVVVGSCDTNGVELTYGKSYDSTSGAYKVDSVTVWDIDATASGCVGKTLQVTLKDSNKAAIGSGSVVVPAAAAGASTVSADVAISGNTDAEPVVGAAVVIG